MITFIRNLVSVKTDQAVNNAVEAIVRWDPQSATGWGARTSPPRSVVRIDTLAAVATAFDVLE